jgi:CP family cyanate transporter-like MFS transporter
MSPVPDAQREHAWRAVALLWLAGAGLRLTILAVPPVITLIRGDFGLNATQVGLLGSIPPALFAIAALLGSLLVARLGVNGAPAGGLAIVAVGSALRGLSGSYAGLLATTIVMSAGVAIMQPVMPSAVRRWLPGHIGFGTAIYTNGLLVGEALPVVLTIPFLLPWLGGGWRTALVAWSLPVAAIAACAALLGPRPPPRSAGASAPRAGWLPDWRRPLVWQLGAVFCCINAIYFSANSFLPIYLKSVGRLDLVSAALAGLNLGQIPASLLLLAVAGRIERRAWPYVASGAASLVAVGGLVFMVGAATPWWAALLGFSDASALIIGLTLPALLCEPEDVARTAAGTFALSYGGAVLLALASGAAWDLTGRPSLAFVPMAACAAGLAAGAWWMRVRGELR